MTYHFILIVFLLRHNVFVGEIEGNFALASRNLSYATVMPRHVRMDRFCYMLYCTLTSGDRNIV